MQMTDKILVASLPVDLQKFISADTKGQAPKEITYGEMLNFRFQYINQLLADEIKTADQFNEEYRQKMRKQDHAVQNLNDMLEKNTTAGGRAADAIARFGGSWPFIVIFVLFLVGWMFLNVTGILFKPFDEYPFILLNLALSCLAAIQAPIIMMSQNRQATRDRAEADNDYKTNLKSETEIGMLHEKIDYLMSTKWEHIVELQQLQIELLGQLQKVDPENNKEKQG